MNTPDMPRKRVRDALRRLFSRPDDDVRPASRISTPHWRRSAEVVSPERDPSEWVHEVMERDWDNVKKGRHA